MRALFYYHALDLFRNIPFVTENDPIGTYVPPRYTPQQTFEYIESELKDCVSNLASKDDCPYGEASKEQPTRCLQSFISMPRLIRAQLNTRSASRLATMP